MYAYILQGMLTLTSDSCVSCSDIVVGYSTWEFQALQRIILAVFGAVELPLAFCILFHFLKIYFEMIVGL